MANFLSNLGGNALLHTVEQEAGKVVENAVSKVMGGNHQQAHGGDQNNQGGGGGGFNVGEVLKLAEGKSDGQGGGLGNVFGGLFK